MSKLLTTGSILGALLGVFINSAVSAADAGGTFAVKGAGMATCETFIAARARQTEAYGRFAGWAEGYLTAMNQLSRDTFDIAPWETTAILMFVANEQCSQRPQERFSVVLQRIVASLQDDRLRKNSPTMTLSSGDRSISIYEDTLRRAQAELAKQGFYSGGIDGKFGPRMQQAVERFQQSRNLTPTGMPDEVTLWMLLRP